MASVELSEHETLSLVFEKIRVVEGEIEECMQHEEYKPTKARIADIFGRLYRMREHLRRACQIVEANVPSDEVLPSDLLRLAKIGEQVTTCAGKCKCVLEPPMPRYCETCAPTLEPT